MIHGQGTDLHGRRRGRRGSRLLPRPAGRRQAAQRDARQGALEREAPRAGCRRHGQAGGRQGARSRARRHAEDPGPRRDARRRDARPQGRDADLPLRRRAEGQRERERRERRRVPARHRRAARLDRAARRRGEERGGRRGRAQPAAPAGNRGAGRARYPLDDERPALKSASPARRAARSSRSPSATAREAGRPFAMSLRPFLAHLERHPDADTLSAPGARAFVSHSLRPYLIAALADRDARRPAVVVASDDRAARDLAADLRAWLRPRAVRFYPSRGVAYESHLTPPAHLVGLRVAALDALLDRPVSPAGRDARSSRSASATSREAPVIVISAVALSEKVPDPALRPHGFALKVGDLLDLDECANDLVAAGYERVDQVEDRGQFAVRGGLLDVYPATEERAIRVDLFDDEIESLRWFSTFTQRSLGDADSVEI